MLEAIMESSFMQGLIEALNVFMTTIVTLAIIGPVGFACGELFPRKWVHYDRFPFKEYKWERNGRLYLKLRVNKWKDKVPDMSSYFKGMFYKKALAQTRSSAYFERFVIETCIAEAVHVGLMLGGFVAYWVFPNAWGLSASILYALGNLPFVLIQRYNRPRFKLLMERQKKIEARNAHAAASEEEK